MDERRRVELTAKNGEKCFISPEDAEWALSLKWITMFKNPKTGVVRFGRCFGGRKRLLHREVVMRKLGLDEAAMKGMEVDHINNDPNDNTRENLRLCSSSENKMNQRKLTDTASKYKGVHTFTTRTGNMLWRSSIHVGGKTVGLGQYESDVDAAMAYNEAAKKYFGEFASLNKLSHKMVPIESIILSAEELEKVKIICSWAHWCLQEEDEIEMATEALEILKSAKKKASENK